MKGGPGVFYTFLLVALICLFLFSDRPFEENGSETPVYRRQLPEGRRGGRRSATKHEPVAFDPLVAEVERRREDRAWEREYWTHQYRTWANHAQDWTIHPNLGKSTSPPDKEEAVVEAPPASEAEAQPEPWDHFNYTNDYEGSEDYVWEDYLNSERFNISHRLELLFPQIDSDGDGSISLEELERWHEHSALRVTRHRTDRDLEVHDLNGDGAVSFSEYLPHLASGDGEGQEEKGGDSWDTGGAAWWREQFENADEDGDEFLNRTEFHEFLHPEDSRVEKIHAWLVRQELKARSAARDGNLTWADFHQNVFDVIRDYGEEESPLDLSRANSYADMEARKESMSRAKFSELDVNEDGFITAEEAEPFMPKLRPGELYYARQQAQHLLAQADDDHDGRLSLADMLAHPYVFYNAAYDHGVPPHDEFR